MRSLLTVLSPGEPFPPEDQAGEGGLLAAGGSLETARLLNAYRRGIFPWPLMGPAAPMLWFSPDPRFVLFPDELHCPRSLAKTLRRGLYRVDMNTCFSEVVRACGEQARPGQDGTWITEAMIEAYEKLHRLGFAHSVEVFAQNEQEGGKEELVGGLYGIALGRVFFGESMFSRARDASKVGFVALVRELVVAGFELIDCQQETRHLGQFGARSISRGEFVERVQRLVDRPPSDLDWAQHVGLGGEVRIL